VLLHQETAEKLEKGIAAVQTLIDQELGPLIDQNRFRDRDAPRERVRRNTCARRTRTGVDRISLDVCRGSGPKRRSSSRLRLSGTSTSAQRSSALECVLASTVPISETALTRFALQGLFVKYIQQETQTRVQIKGIGSGFVETDTGREGEDPMHIHVT
jgi:hypothetical protein